MSKGLSLSLCLSVNKCEFVELERVGLSVRGKPVGWESLGSRVASWLRVEEGDTGPKAKQDTHEKSQGREMTSCPLPRGLRGPLCALIH